MGNRVVSQAIPKVDYKALVTGKAVYTDDLAAKDSLVVKVLRSPHAHALIQDINLTRAELVPDIECILTYKDCPDKRFTMAGQTYPEPSPYDRLILDQRVRFVGDAVAIVAGRTKEAVNKALKLIKVKYEVLEPVLDFHKAKDNPILVHPEENWKSLCPVGADNKRNLCAHDSCEEGDIEAVLAVSYKGKPAGNDGNIQNIYISGYVWKIECPFVHTGSVPCTADSCKCIGYSKVEDSCDQAKDRRRFRGKTVCCLRSLSGTGNMENGKTGKDDFYKRRIYDCILSAA